MVSITLKNIPKFLHAKLKKQAKTNRRSLSGEIFACLESVPLLSNPEAAQILTRARALRKNIKGHLSYQQLRHLKEAGRKCRC